MAFNKVALLILLGTFLLLSEWEYADAAVCPRNCNPNIRYGRCPKSGNKKFKVGCTNCCSGIAGCNYFSANGTFICEGQTTKTQVEETIETREETNKACPRNCNPNIRYGRCPKSGNKKFKVGCTNCCSGIAGCNYFSANGTFICEGQTKKTQVEETIETRDETNKVCPFNCNPRIAYSICPGNKRSKGRICTNCCVGRKGCNYYSTDGTFVCEGESKVESY